MLWYVLLRERNVLATQREERRRLGIVGAYGGELITKRVQRVSLARPPRCARRARRGRA